jgi:formylglycine-generating enzyme required for sulfatase activity
MIEVAPEEYWIKSTYEDAKFYCFSLNIDGKSGWRLPTREEWIGYDDLINVAVTKRSSWFREDDMRKHLKYRFIPVRDIRNEY